MFLFHCRENRVDLYSGGDHDPLNHGWRLCNEHADVSSAPKF